MTNDILKLHNQLTCFSNEIITSLVTEPKRLEALRYIQGALAALAQLATITQGENTHLKCLFNNYHTQGLRLLSAKSYEDATKIEVNHE